MVLRPQRRGLGGPKKGERRCIRTWNTAGKKSKTHLSQEIYKQYPKYNIYHLYPLYGMRISNLNQKHILGRYLTSYIRLEEEAAEAVAGHHRQQHGAGHALPLHLAAQRVQRPPSARALHPGATGRQRLADGDGAFRELYGRLWREAAGGVERADPAGARAAEGARATRPAKMALKSGQKTHWDRCKIGGRPLKLDGNSWKFDGIHANSMEIQ